MKYIKLSQAFLSAFLLSASVAAEEKNSLFSHMLVGGSLKTCSSFAVSQCTDSAKFSTNAKQQHLYSLSETHRLGLKKLINEHTVLHSDPSLRDLLEDIDGIAPSDQTKQYTKRELLRYLDNYRLGQRVDRLNDAHYYAFFDALEVNQTNNTGQRLREESGVEFNASVAAQQIYDAFFNQVRQIHARKDTRASNKPLVLVITASARDPFEAADFYESAFANEDIDAQWLPITPAFLTALQQRQYQPNICNDLAPAMALWHQYDRARVYPDRVEQMEYYCANPNEIVALLERASGIFFNGGDQSKTLAAFIQNGLESEYLQRLLALNQQGEIIIGGTSAGTAVQAGGSFNQRPTVMITNGTSVNAIARGAFSYIAPSQRCTGADCASGIEGNDLTYLATGGLASFPIGILDTHFSERNREARLIVLSAQTGARYGFGVDETTALFTRFSTESLDYHVVGAGGVFAVDNHFSRFIIEHTPEGRQSSYAGLVNFLPSDTSGSVVFADNQWSMTTVPSTEDSATVYPNEGIWRSQAATLCEKAEPVRFRIDNYDILLQPSEQTTTLQPSDNKPCGYLNLPFAIVGVNE